MRMLLVAGFGLLFAAPSFAQEMSTVQYILAKGVSMHAELVGRPVEMNITYNPDGTSVTKIMGAGGRGAEVPGKWRVDGEKFCTTNAMNPEETCFAVPAGKKPGDAMKVTTPAMGEVTLTINP